MDLHELEYIVTASEYDTLEKAADALGISKSTLSREISRISHLVRAPLFLRGHRLTLTEAGAEYVRTAREILSVRDHAFKLIQSLENAGDQHFRAAISPHIDSHLLGSMYPEYMERYPQSRIELKEAYSAEAARLVRNGRAEIGLGFLSTKLSDIPDLVFLPVQEIEVIICICDINEAASGGAVSPDEGERIPGRKLECFRDIPYISPLPDSYFGSLMKEFFRAADIEPLSVNSSPSRDMALTMINAYNGFSTLMIDDCADAEGVRMFRVDPPLCCFKGFYVRRDLKIPACLKEFLEMYAAKIQAHYRFSALLHPTEFRIPDKMLEQEEKLRV